MDVLVVGEAIRRRDRLEDALCLLELRVVEEAGGAQAPGVQSRALEVVRQQLGVLRQEVRPDLGRHPFTDPARPEGHVVSAVTRLRAAASSAFQRGEAHEAFGRLVRERLAGRVGRERLRVEGLIASGAP